MIPFIRLSVAIVSGVAGMAAIFLVLRPATIANQNTWTLAAVTVLMAATLFSTVISLMGDQPEAAVDPHRAPPASNADREVHSEVAKIIMLLGSQVEATDQFSAALTRAQNQLPDGLKPEQVRLVISYLMIEKPPYPHPEKTPTPTPNSSARPM